MKSARKVSGNREVYTCSYLRSISYLAYHDASESRERRQNNILISMLFSAFCLEAYLNHVGGLKVPAWNAMERRLSPIAKLEVLSAHLNFKINYSIKPFQTFKGIFSFRQKLAHGKSQYLSIEGEQLLGEDEDPSLPQADWEKPLNLKIARAFLEDTKEMTTFIDTQAGLKGTIEILDTNTCWS